VVGQLRQQVEQRGVGPVQVLDHEQDGLMLGAQERDLDQRVDGQLPLAVRRQVERRVAILERNRQELGEQRSHAREVEAVLRQEAVDLVEALLDRVVRPELQDALQVLDDRVEGRVHEVRRTGQADEECVSGLGHKLLERPGQTRLSDTRLAGHEGDAAMTRPGSGPAAGQPAQLAPSTLHGGKPALDGDVEAGPRRTLVQHVVDRHRLRDAANALEAELAAVEVARDQPIRRGADHHRVGLGLRLEPRGDVRRDADRRWGLHPLVGGDGAGHDQAGVDADANVEVDISFGLKAAVELVEGFDDAEPAPHRPLSVVLVGRWKPEVDHDAVARVVVNVALEAADDGCADALVIGQRVP
jgi:hypothetical protein